jgi:hypothetical protein
MPVVKGDIYNVCVLSLLPLMLSIGGTAIIIGKHHARRFADASCLGLANKHNK